MIRYLGLYAGGVGGDGGESSHNKPIPSNYLLEEENLNRLKPGQWIDDAVITTFMYDICEKNPQFAFFDPIQVNLFMIQKREYKKRDQPYDWSEKIGVFCPLNVNENHWVLYYVTRTRVYYYDSFGFGLNENQDTYIKRIKPDIIIPFWTTFQRYANYSVKDFRDWFTTTKQLEVYTLSNYKNKQSDYINCGAYVMRMMELITQTPSDQPLTDKEITSFEIPFFREATRSMLDTTYRDANSQPTYSPTSSVEEVSPPPGN